MTRKLCLKDEDSLQQVELSRKAGSLFIDTYFFSKHPSINTIKFGLFNILFKCIRLSLLRCR